jgi:hypothetical protein
MPGLSGYLLRKKPDMLTVLSNRRRCCRRQSRTFGLCHSYPARGDGCLDSHLQVYRIVLWKTKPQMHQEVCDLIKPLANVSTGGTGY